MRFCQCKGKEAGEADLLAEKKCVEVKALFCGRNDNLEWRLRESRVSEKCDEFVDFPFAESGSGRRDAEKRLFQAAEECEV